MLRILEQKDTSAYETLISGLDLSPYAQLHISEATENDGVKGFIVYSYTPEEVTIHALDDGGDLNQCDGLVRSVLFKAELKGIERAVFLVNEPAMRQRLELLRFVKNDENVLENIANIMDSCKSCKENRTNS
ncbi:MAG: hypothetical protein II916_06400 [Oscillospiraceae bacterium]|nr:hypothetical protein [Oscillospiraceae bacterium]